MRIGRALPPAAAPMRGADLWRGLGGLLRPAQTIQSIERQFREHFGVDHVFLLSSGTAALTLTLQALKSTSARRDVVLPAYTCFSVPAAVLKAGLRPVLCDVDPRTFDFNHAQLARTLTANTLCVVAHHLFGIPSAIERIRALCVDRQVAVVEDAAQALGGERHGRKLGTLGDAGIFSFGRGKNITCGSGGVIVTSSPVVAAAIEREYRQLTPCSRFEAATDLLSVLLMMIFIRPRLYWLPAAMPFLGLGQTIFPKTIPLRPLSGGKAGLLHDWRRRLAESNERRSAAAAYFGAHVPLPSAQQPPPPYVRLPLLAPTPADKQRLYALSQARGLGLSAAYPAAIGDLAQLRGARGGQSCPAARRLAGRVVTLPTHHWVSDADRRHIAALCRTVAAS